jgi:uncharacterized membrane protein
MVEGFTAPASSLTYTLTVSGVAGSVGWPRSRPHSQNAAQSDRYALMVLAALEGL